MRLQPDGQTYKSDDGVTMSAEQVKSLVPDAFAEAESQDAYKDGVVKNFGTSADPDWRERSGGRWVPLDDVGTRAADPSQLLGANGYKWQSGTGPSALWLDPEGRTVTESAATTRVQREGAVAPKAVPGSASNPNVMTAGQSAQIGVDYARLGLQREQLAEEIRQADAQMARDNQLLILQQDKFRAEQLNGDKDRMERAQERADAIRWRIEDTQYKRAELEQRMALTTMQIESEERQSAAGLQQRNAEMQQRAAEAGLADRLKRDTAIAEYSASPTDVGKVSAFLNRDGMSNLSTAIGQGETAITDQSLEPLANLLNPNWNRPVPEAAPPPVAPYVETEADRFNAAMARGRALAAAHNAGIDPGVPMPNVAITEATRRADEYNFSQQARPSMAPNTSNLLNDPLVLKMLVGQEGAGSQDAIKRALEAQGHTQAPKMEHGGAVVGDGQDDGQFLNGLMRLVQMLGMEPKAVAGEKGQANGETVYSNGDVVVMPDKGKGMPAMAEGGAVVGGFLNPLLQFARDFQTKVGQDTLKRSGFQRAPTPVELSDPGTDPFRQQLGAATTAAVTGIPQQSFLNELLRLRPQGMQRGYASRTR